MSGVDVLAVMDRAAVDELPLMSAADMKEARAAVAELIEAAHRLERKAIEQARLTSSVFNSDVESLRNALSRVRGETP